MWQHIGCSRTFASSIPWAAGLLPAVYPALTGCLGASAWDWGRRERKCKRLAELPGIDVAFAQGQVSYSKLMGAQGQTIDVGRKTRVISPALRRALEHRDDGCQFPGCSNTRFVDAHHIQHWVDGGETNLQNTITLCRRHHRFVHEWDYSMERVADAWVFVRPDGQRVSAAPPRPEVSPISELAIAKALTDNRLAADSGEGCHSWPPGWDGTPVDYEACVDSLGFRPAMSQSVAP